MAAHVERIPISGPFEYLVPAAEARASFLGCCGLLIGDRLTGVIDGNMGPPETTGFLESVSPDVCVVSHFHVDHSRWAHEAASMPGVTVRGPEEEWRYLADVDHFIERCGLPDPALASAWREWLTGFAGLEPVPSAVPLPAGERLDFGRTAIEVVAAGGHSPGHQAYWDRASRVLFCSDIGVDRFGPWYGWRDANLEEYVRSIHRLAALGARILATSHGGIIEGESEARRTLMGCLDVIRGRDRTIAADLDCGMDVAAIAARGHIYGDTGRFPPPLDRMYRIWEENMVREHARVIEIRGGVDGVDH